MNHEDEGPERLGQIVSRAREDAQWVLQKVGLPCTAGTWPVQLDRPLTCVAHRRVVHVAMRLSPGVLGCSSTGVLSRYPRTELLCTFCLHLCWRAAMAVRQGQGRAQPVRGGLGAAGHQQRSSPACAKQQAAAAHTQLPWVRALWFTAAPAAGQQARGHRQGACVQAACSTRPWAADLLKALSSRHPLPA